MRPEEVLEFEEENKESVACRRCGSTGDEGEQPSTRDRAPKVGHGPNALDDGGFLAEERGEDQGLGRAAVAEDRGEQENRGEEDGLARREVVGEKDAVAQSVGEDQGGDQGPRKADMVELLLLLGRWKRSEGPGHSQSVPGRRGAGCEAGEGFEGCEGCCGRG